MARQRKASRTSLDSERPSGRLMVMMQLPGATFLCNSPVDGSTCQTTYRDSYRFRQLESSCLSLSNFLAGLIRGPHGHLRPGGHHLPEDECVPRRGLDDLDQRGQGDRAAVRAFDILREGGSA